MADRSENFRFFFEIGTDTDSIAGFEKELDAKEEQDEVENGAHNAEADGGTSEADAQIHGENDGEVDDGEDSTGEEGFAGLGKVCAESWVKIDGGKKGFKAVFGWLFEPVYGGVVKICGLASGGKIFVGVEHFEVDFELAVVVGDGDYFGHPVCTGVRSVFF